MLGQSGVVGLERSIAFERHIRCKVPYVKVLDHRIDRPVLERRDLLKVLLAQRGDERMKRLAFLSEIPRQIPHTQSPSAAESRS